MRVSLYNDCPTWKYHPGPATLTVHLVLINSITGILRGLWGKLSAVIVIVVVVVWFVMIIDIIVSSVELVAVVVSDVIDGRELLPHLVQESVPLPDGPGHHTTSEPSGKEDDDEDAGPEAAAEAVTAGVALPAGRAILRLLPLWHRQGLPQHGRVQTLTALHHVLSCLEGEDIISQEYKALV